MSHGGMAHTYTSLGALCRGATQLVVSWRTVRQADTSDDRNLPKSHYWCTPSKIVHTATDTFTFPTHSDQPLMSSSMCAYTVVYIQYIHRQILRLGMLICTHTGWEVSSGSLIVHLQLCLMSLSVGPERHANPVSASLCPVQLTGGGFGVIALYCMDDHVGLPISLRMLLSPFLRSAETMF